MKAGLPRWSVAPILTLACLGGFSSPNTWALPPMESGEKLITILATNDIHGGIEARPARDGKLQGGLDFWAGAIRSIRQGLDSQLSPDRHGVLVLDAGDQFQGTLLSNFNEGRLAMEALSRAGLDAAVPGNHDYDFGPVGWLMDQAPAGQPSNTPETDPRGALKRAIEGVSFPLLSANTYLRSSVRDWEGHPLEIESAGCRPKDSTREAAFVNAEHPEFLKPYQIVERAGVRIALIGLDHEATASMTTQANVTDLCFRDSVDTYIELRNQLEGKADLFILLVHGGNSPNNPEISHKVEEILNRMPGRTNVLHAVVAGHTHMVHRDWVRGIPIVQSGSGGELFGRIDLVWNPERQTLNPYEGRATAGIRLLHEGCSPFTEFQCREEPDTHAPVLEGVRVEADADIALKIRNASNELAPVGQRILGRAEKNLSRDRIGESPLSNALTDALLSASGAEVALLNTGGLRESIPAGDITYANFFTVLPFNNRAVLIERLQASRLIRLLEKSIRTCGDYGALLAGGIRVEFERHCPAPLPGAAAGTDDQARLTRVVFTGSGEVLLDTALGIQPSPERTIRAATLDFLAAGGSAYSDFVGAEVSQDLGIFREVLVDQFLKSPPVLSGGVDGRWKNIAGH